jgi:hypothetical protein
MLPNGNILFPLAGSKLASAECPACGLAAKRA